MRKITRKGLVRKLDKIVSQIVIARDGKCIVCGTTQNLTCGHLFSRIAYSTRWDLDNCYAQCRNCNFRHESDPYPMTEAVKNMYGENKLKEGLLLNITEVEDWLFELHKKYVTPHKYKNYELAELLQELEEMRENG